MLFTDFVHLFRMAHRLPRAEAKSVPDKADRIPGNVDKNTRSTVPVPTKNGCDLRNIARGIGRSVKWDSLQNSYNNAFR